MLVLNSFDPEWRGDIVKVYSHPEGVMTGIKQVSTEKMIPVSAMWSLINRYERKVARLIIIEEV